MATQFTSPGQSYIPQGMSRRRPGQGYQPNSSPSPNDPNNPNGGGVDAGGGMDGRLGAAGETSDAGAVFQPAPGFPGFTSGNQANPVNPDPNTQNPSGASNTQTTSNTIQPNLRDVYDQFQNNRAQAGAWGQNFDQTMGGNADYSSGMAKGYDQLTPNLYSDIWNGGGGYTPDQSAAIQGNSGPTGLDNLYGKSQTELPGNFLSTQEQQAASGNPYAGYSMYAGQVPKIEATDASGAAGVNNSVGSMQAGYNSAIDPNALSLNPDYAGNQQKTVNAGVGQMNAAANNPSLGISNQYQQQAGMTDAEVNQMAQARSAEVGSSYRSAQDQLEQNAKASGTVNPLGIAAAQNQNQYASAMAQGDALNQGELDARAAQRAASTGVEQTRLGAQQYQSGMQQDVAQKGMAAQQGNTAQTENMRLGAAQDLSGRQMTAAGAVGQAGVNAAQFNATNANTTANTTANNLSSQYGSAENTQANRAYQLGANRQTANTAAQTTGFNQGMAVNDAASQRGTTIANQQQQQQAEGRQAAMGMGQYYGNQQNTQNQLRLGGQQVTGNLVNRASQGYAGWGNAQNSVGFGSNLEKGLGGSLGSSLGTFGGSTNSSGNWSAGMGRASGGQAPASSVLITPDGNYHPIGEDGPEMIVPLAPNRQGQWEYQPDRGSMGRSPTSGEVRSPYARSDYDMDNYGGPSDFDEDNLHPTKHGAGDGLACGGMVGGGHGGYASGGLIGTNDSDPSFSGSSPTTGPLSQMFYRSMGYAAGGIIPGVRDPQPLRVAMGRIEMPSATIAHGGQSMIFHPPHTPSNLIHGGYRSNVGRSKYLPGGSSHFSEMGNMRSPAYG